jgi:Tfp pilus assembly protein PilO
MPSLQKDYYRYKNYFLDVLKLYKDRSDVKVFLEIILSLVSITVFAAFAIRPTILTILELNKEIKSKEEVVGKLNSKILSLQSANETLQAVAPDLIYLDQAVPPMAKPEDFVRQIEGLASTSTVSILGLSASDVILLGKPTSNKSREVEALPQSASEVPITVSVTGAYPNLMVFVSKLENLRRPIKIDSLSISAAETEEGKKITMVVTGRTPYLDGN